MKRGSVLNWIGQQIISGGNDLPAWDAVRQQWYVCSLDRYFDDFARAVESACSGSVSRYRPMVGAK